MKSCLGQQNTRANPTPNCDALDSYRADVASLGTMPEEILSTPDPRPSCDWFNYAIPAAVYSNGKRKLANENRGSNKGDELNRNQRGW